MQPETLFWQLHFLVTAIMIHSLIPQPDWLYGGKWCCISFTISFTRDSRILSPPSTTLYPKCASRVAIYANQLCLFNFFFNEWIDLSLKYLTHNVYRVSSKCLSGVWYLPQAIPVWSFTAAFKAMSWAVPIQHIAVLSTLNCKLQTLLFKNRILHHQQQ